MRQPPRRFDDGDPSTFQAVRKLRLNSYTVPLQQRVLANGRTVHKRHHGALPTARLCTVPVVPRGLAAVVSAAAEIPRALAPWRTVDRGRLCRWAGRI